MPRFRGITVPEVVQEEPSGGTVKVPPAAPGVIAPNASGCDGLAVMITGLGGGSWAIRGRTLPKRTTIMINGSHPDADLVLYVFSLIIIRLPV